MKIKRICLCAWLVLGLIWIAPAVNAQEKENNSTTADEVKQETSELIRSLQSYSADQRDQAVRRAQGALDDMDKRVNELQSDIDKRWDEMDSKAQERALESLSTLENKRAQVAEWFESLKSGSSDAWEHIKQGFSDAYTGLNQAWEKSKEEFDPPKDK
ncbi:MAG: hypothetical protein ACLFSY_08345 [Desulfonatronovibrionaceae bacterium]